MLQVHASARNCEIVELEKKNNKELTKRGREREKKEERSRDRERRSHACKCGASAWKACFFEGRTYDRRCRSPCTNPAEAAGIDL